MISGIQKDKKTLKLFCTAVYWPVNELKKPGINWNTEKCGLSDTLVVSAEIKKVSRVKKQLV